MRSDWNRTLVQRRGQPEYTRHGLEFHRRQDGVIICQRQIQRTSIFPAGARFQNTGSIPSWWVIPLSSIFMMPMSIGSLLVGEEQLAARASLTSLDRETC